MRANQLMAEGKIQPVLWKVMGFDGVAEAHQLLHENKHLGKISILVGATSEEEGKEEDGPGAIRAEVGVSAHRSGRGDGGGVCYIDWRVHPFRAERWYETWEPAAERAMSFGAKAWSLTRSIEDPLLFRQSSVWEDRTDFERYWYSDEVTGDPRAGAQLLQQAAEPAVALAGRRRIVIRAATSSRACVFLTR